MTSAADSRTCQSASLARAIQEIDTYGSYKGQWHDCSPREIKRGLSDRDAHDPGLNPILDLDDDCGINAKGSPGSESSKEGRNSSHLDLISTGAR
jgi:hypothetical protein